MKSFKLYRGQELQYDGQRMEWEDEPEYDERLPKSVLKRLQVQQEERQEEEEVYEELTEWEKEEARDNTMGIFILCGFLVIAVTNLMKYGQL